MDAPRVFLSAGTKRTDGQDDFIEALKEMLSNAGFETRQAQWSAISPLAKIKEEMNGCSGAIMVAFERVYAKQGKERLDATKFASLKDVRLTTVWNHVEAAMAYCLDLPLLIVCEPNLREEGLLEKFDWYIHRTRLSEVTVHEPEFVGIFQDWAGRVRKRQRQPESGLKTEIDPDNLTIGAILRSMSVVKFVALLGFVLTILGAVFVAGSKWPGLAQLFE